MFSLVSAPTIALITMMLLVTNSKAFTFAGGSKYGHSAGLHCSCNRIVVGLEKDNRKKCPSPRTTRIFSAAKHAYGKGMDQLELMENDMLVCVDLEDVPSGKMSKKEAHTFNHVTPRGWAHRAFSVFLFDGNGEMLLTQRAASKITFPSVWTNTCCSHPLYGQVVNEVDQPDDYPTFPGIKHAAIRKLYHELGIVPGDVPHNDFHFLTRYHYWAADTVTYGEEAPWGEHEIDYILFIQCAGKGPKVNANPEEVDDHKYVSIEDLKNMMHGNSEEHRGLLWSPWFRGIMENGGFLFWENLEEALQPGSRFCNSDIVYFDPPKEHCASYNLSMHGKETGVVRSKLINCKHK